MFAEIFLLMLLGCGIGFVTGLIPGLHPNSLFLIFFVSIPFFSFLPVPYVITLIVSISIANTFTNFVPSILLGAPEDESSLSVLPGHRLLLSGKGLEAVSLTALGGLGVVVLTVVSSPLLIIALPAIYTAITPYLHIILSGLVVWMVLTSRKKAFSLLVFLAAGLIGFIALQSLPSQVVLFPALTGLFGISQLAISLFQRVRLPPQEGEVKIESGFLKGSFTGWLSGMLAGILPGIGSAQAAIITSHIFRNKVKDFLVSIGGIASSNILFTFLVFYTLGKTRSGAVWTLSQVTENILPAEIYLIMIVALLSAFLSALFTIRFSKLIVHNLHSFNYRQINTFIIIFLVFSVAFASGWIGLLILFLTFWLGTLTVLIEVRRVQLMGFLVLPTIIFYAGLITILLNVLGL